MTDTTRTSLIFRYTLIILALFGLWLLPFAFFPQSDARLAYIDISLPIFNLAATIGLGLAAWKTYPSHRRAGRFWLILALAQLSYTLADVVWLVIEVWLKQEPFPSLADFFYLAYYPLFLIAVLYLPTSPRSPRDTLKINIEIVIVLISAGLYLRNFIIDPLIAQSADASVVELVISLAYPLGDLLVLLAMLALIFRKSENIGAGPLVLLTIVAFTTILTDMLFIVSYFRDTYSSSDWLNAGYLMGYILTGMAGVRQVQIVSSEGEHQQDQDKELDGLPLRQGRLHNWLPSATLAAAYLLLVLSFNFSLNLSFPTMAFWVGVLLLLTIALQQIVTWENNWLSSRLHRLNQELEQRVTQRTAELERTNQELQAEIKARLSVTEALQVNEALYRAVVEDIPLFICRFLPDGTLTFVNEAYCSYFKIAREDLIGHSFFNLIPEEDRQFVRSRFESLTQLSPVVKYEHRVINADGEIRWQRWIDRAVFDGDKLIEYQSIGEDVTEQRLHEDALRESEEKFRDLFDSSSDLIQIIAPDSRFLYVNQAWKKVMGYSDAEISQLTLWDIIHPDHLPECRKAFENALSGVSNFNCEAVFITRDGKSIHVEGNTNCKYKDGKPEYIRGIFHDVTQRKLNEQQLIRHAFYDTLTSLPNRNLLMEYLRHSVETALSRPDYQYAVLFLDLDNFKLVNDSLGHLLGDQLLVAVSERLRSCIRSRDLVARLSGDEFIILLDGINDRRDAAQIAERVLEELRKPFQVNGHKIVITVSIGIVMNNTSGNEEDNLSDADIAMYRAKARGKNCYQFFEPQMRIEAIERLRMENDLRNAHQRGEFSLYYQPIVRLEDSQIVGFEALLRWNHPERGMTSPLDFIPVLEETGLIISVGDWVLYEACAQMVQWQRLYPMLSSMIISVNISMRQLLHEDFSDHVVKALKDTGLAPTCLALEVTESILLEDLALASDILETLARLGIKIHIDDFGTGYSSLGRLQNLPISTIKIDRSFIGQVTPVSENQDLVRAISILSHELGLEMIAEGIEQDYQLDYLLNLGCNLGQGFYFSRPVPAQDVPKLLHQHLLSQPGVDVLQDKAIVR